MQKKALLRAVLLGFLCLLQANFAQAYGASEEVIQALEVSPVLSSEAKLRPLPIEKKKARKKKIKRKFKIFSKKSPQKRQRSKKSKANLLHALLAYPLVALGIGGYVVGVVTQLTFLWILGISLLLLGLAIIVLIQAAAGWASVAPIYAVTDLILVVLSVVAAIALLVLGLAMSLPAFWGAGILLFIPLFLQLVIIILAES
ncbi:MAG: hypothetical protein MK212_04780 [Saprospiraceae bacterium]|nr:hypothetical protein [Saprospiraceae bacterium]